MYKRKRGYITVFLSMVIAAMLIFIITLIEITRIQTIRFQIEGVMDIGLSSIFAEYHREMLNRYGLLFIDTSYGTTVSNTSLTESHLLNYMNQNFEIPKTYLSEAKDLTMLQADNVTINCRTYASDGSGEVLKYQIIKYMKTKEGISDIENFMDSGFLYEEGKRYEDYESDRKKTEGKIETILDEINRNKEESEEDITIENPADEINGKRSNSILEYAISDDIRISNKSINLSDYISHRNYKQGDGLFSYQKKPSGVEEKLLFQKYLYGVCGCYGKIRDQSALDYQMEYLIYGKNNDFANLEAFAKEIFALRYVTNITHLFTDPGKQAQAYELALAVTSGIMHPELAEAVKVTILFAWAYAESIQDMRIIFDGKKVGSVKNDTNWNIEISELLSFSGQLNSYHEDPMGENYEGYLRKKLFVVDEKKLLIRLMDIMEMDIRKTAGNQNFKMDQCIYQLEATVNVSSEYGYGFDITRSYSYQ